VLPLFGGIYKRGAGIGAAVAFLYSGPAINVLAIVYTARLLGYDLGVARAIGAISFSVGIGLLMSLIYRKEESQKDSAAFDALIADPEWQELVAAGHLLCCAGRYTDIRHLQGLDCHWWYRMDLTYTKVRIK
jgi:hypothetical protein